MAMSRVIFEAWETVRRFSLQFDPRTTTSYLERWEAILGVVPGPDLTFNERRRLLVAKWDLVGRTPTSQAVTDLLASVLGPIFVEILRIPSTQALMSMPGGMTVLGGNTVPDGDWYSSVSHIPVRVTLPPSMTLSAFVDRVALFLPFFYDIMPSYVTYEWGSYGTDAGTVSISIGSTTLTGTGTLFLTSPSGAVTAGDEIEVRDEDGTLLTFVVASVTTDTSLEVTVAPVNADVTNSYWARLAFILDSDHNLDFAFLSEN